MLLGILFAALASGASVYTERTYLSGHGCDDAVAWSFEIDKGPRAGVKTTIPVPSCWEMQGFGELQYGQYVRGLGKKWENLDPFAGTAVYRHSFAEPASARGRHVDLCFEAVFTDCDVELNGQRLGCPLGMMCGLAGSQPKPSSGKSPDDMSPLAQSLEGKEVLQLGQVTFHGLLESSIQG